jgi:hypothetical protein
MMKSKMSEIKYKCINRSDLKGLPPSLRFWDHRQAKVNALRELQSAGGEELSALIPSVLDRAFKGEL